MLRTLIVLVAFACLLSTSAGATSSVPVLVITLHGEATAKRPWPVETRENGRWKIRWLVPESELAVGRRFLSDSASVVGSATAHGASVSCHAPLAARRAPFQLLVATKNSREIGFIPSPSAFATAVAPGCQQGVSASHWPLRTKRERKDWWIFNHAGVGVTLPEYGPAPQGGSGEGWKLHYGVHWLVTLGVEIAP